MNIVVTIASIVTLSLFSWQVWRNDNSPIRKYFWPAWIIKLSAGIVLGIIYSTIYTDTDTFFFFNEGVEWSRLARIDAERYLNFLITEREGYFVGEERLNFMVKLASIVSLFSGDNYWVVSCWFSFLSFLAAWKITKTISAHVAECTVPAVLAFLFFPSCVFWSSGILKETLSVAALFYLASIFLKVWFNEKISILNLLLVVALGWIGWKLKYYYFGLFLAIVMAIWLARKISRIFKANKIWHEAIILLFILALGLITVSFLHPNFSLHKIAGVIVSNNLAFMELSSDDDVIHYYQLKPTLWSFMLNSPWALVSGLFRPFVWEANTILQSISSLENLLLFILTITSIRYFTRCQKSEHRLLVMGALLYCVLLCILLAISCPNFGTLVRYRVGFLPFLVLLITNHPILIRSFSKIL